MPLQALKLTKENLPIIADTIGVNPESLKLLAANRDKYVMFETWTIDKQNNWSMMNEITFNRNFDFATPESNRFIDVVYAPKH